MHSLLIVAALIAPVWSVPTSYHDLQERAISQYAPTTVQCPSTPLVRPARGISSQESSYISSRKSKASSSLASWLKKQGTFSTSSQPVVGFSSSGGGYRALLETAGVVQGFDSRDSSVGTSGVYQGLTYQAGLSGGSWFLSSLAGNNWPTVTSLKTGLWEQAFQNSLIVPANLLSTAGLTTYAAVVADVAAKEAAGYDTTIIDPWGRLLSYQLLYGTDGGVADRLSGLTSKSNFVSHSVPYPIITTTTDFPKQGQCFPELNSPIFEFHPYEYGSWDSGISAFAQTKYMGTNMTGGKPVSSSKCTANYDNLGYVFGTSSDIFNSVCGTIQPSNNSANLPGVLEGIVAESATPAADDIFGVYPNPFYKYQRSTLVSGDQDLTLSDGGESLQNIPIWPFIQPDRNVNVLIANDNSADTSDNFPNGTEIHQTYVRAQAVGLSKMPYIPDVATFVSEGLNKRATFFGCNETGTMFIVYLPNVNYTFPSNEPTSKIQYSKAETDGMIANGVQIATQNGASNWPFCLACAIKNGDGSKLPAKCNACFKQYCYYK
jgi:lysophospholipase